MHKNVEELEAVITDLQAQLRAEVETSARLRADIDGLHDDVTRLMAHVGLDSR